MGRLTRFMVADRLPKQQDTSEHRGWSPQHAHRVLGWVALLIATGVLLLGGLPAVATGRVSAGQATTDAGWTVLVSQQVVPKARKSPQATASAKPGSGTKPNADAPKASPSAQPSASASASASPAAATPVMGGGMGMLLKPDPKPTATKVSDLKPEPRPSSLASTFLGADDWSQYTLTGPRPAFIDGDQRMSLPMAEPTIELARFFNGTARTLVAFTVWLTDNVVNFGVGQAVIPAASAAGKALQTGVVGKIRLGDLALLIAVAVIAWRAISGNRVHAVRDTVLGIAIVGLGMIGMATPQGPVCASLSVVAGLSRFFITLTGGVGSTALVDVCAAQPAAEAASVFSPIKTSVFTAFVQEPFLALQWGQLSDQCKQLALDIANAGYFGDSPEPRNVMSTNGCATAANFNGSAGIDRAVFAGLHLLMVLGWSVGMIALLVPMVAAQGVGAALIVTAPLVWAVGAVPGAGHHLLGTWLYTGFKAAIGMVVSGALLAVVLGASTVIAPADQRLLAIFIPTVMVVGLALVKWKQRSLVAS